MENQKKGEIRRLGLDLSFIPQMLSRLLLYARDCGYTSEEAHPIPVLTEQTLYWVEVGTKLTRKLSKTVTDCDKF